jgi:acyl-CoA synthetase (AMP-forming)/AMP-acid ligase II
MAADGLLARLYRHAAERPASPAYRQADGASLNYEQLAQRASAVAGLLRERLPPRAIVILSCANQIEYPAAFLGILAAGCTVFPVSSEAADAELMRAASQSGALGAIGDARAVRLLAPAASLTLSRNDVSSLPTPTATIQPPAETPGDLLLQSSGTTALPKIARRTGLSLDAVSAAMAEAIRFSPADRVLMTVPLTHSYGLEHGLLAPIWAGSSVGGWTSRRCGPRSLTAASQYCRACRQRSKCFAARWAMA